MGTPSLCSNNRKTVSFHISIGSKRTSLELAQRAINLAVFLCVVFTGVTGLFAIVIKHERSGVLFTSVLLLIFVIAFNLGPLVHG